MTLPRTPSTRPPLVGLDELRIGRARLAGICTAFPETVAVNPWEKEHLSLEVAGKRFGYFLHRHFGDDDRSGAVPRAAPGTQEMLVRAEPDRFWVPAFVGRHGWVGIRLDLEEPDWDVVAGFVEDAWLLTAPKRVRKAFESKT